MNMCVYNVQTNMCISVFTGRTRLHQPESDDGLSPMQYTTYPSLQEKGMGISSDSFPHTHQQTGMLFICCEAIALFPGSLALE